MNIIFAHFEARYAKVEASIFSKHTNCQVKHFNFWTFVFFFIDARLLFHQLNFWNLQFWIDYTLVSLCFYIHVMQI